ncbi:MAG: cellulose biosynthesis protein BcsS [Rhizobiales bacterium]|nr:cellulose biosynthesis protein BcsS [Hyphomicrobiales bacterium]
MMRCRVLILSAALLAGATSAQAQEWYTGAARTPQNDTRPSVAIDLSLTGSSQDSKTGTLIGTIAPFSKLEETGLRLRLSGLLGSYNYISTTAGVGRVQGTQASGSLLVGYEWVTRTATFAGYIGAEINNNNLDKVDIQNKSAGMAGGLKVSADFYANPTDYTMVSGVFSFSTAHMSYYARLKAGIAIVDRIFVGPEVLFLGDNFYSQWRAGAHVSGLRFGALQFGLSGGYVSDRVRGTGFYGILDARITF